MAETVYFLFSLIHPVGKFKNFTLPDDLIAADGRPTIGIGLLTAKQKELTISSEYRLFLNGRSKMEMPLVLADIFGDNLLPGINLVWEIEPSDIEFPQNQFFSKWYSVNELILEDKVLYNGGRLQGDDLEDTRQTAKALMSDPDVQASIRFEVATAPSEDRYWMSICSLPETPASIAGIFKRQSNLMSTVLGRIDCHTIYAHNIKFAEHVYHAPFVFAHGGKLTLKQYQELIEAGISPLLSFMRIIHNLSATDARKYVEGPGSMVNENKSRHPWSPVDVNGAPTNEDGDPLSAKKKALKRTSDGSSKEMTRHESSGTVTLAKFGTTKSIFNYVTTCNEQAKPLLCLAYASRTWDSYLTAWRSLIHFFNLKGLKHLIPLTSDVLCNYICFLKFDRKLEASTVKSYVSAIKTLHELNGTSTIAFENAQIKLLLRAASNLSTVEDKNNFTRNVMTFSVLQIFGYELHRDKKLNPLDRQTLWTVALVGYHGSFRLGELLSYSPSKFDPMWDMKWDNVKVKDDNQVVIVSKLPKTSEDPRGHVVDLLRMEKKSMCPVYNLEKLLRMQKNVYLDDPVFRMSDGRLLTMKMMNDALKKYLKPVFPEATFTCHSFRDYIF